MVRNQYRHDSMKKLPKESWFKWECDNPESLSDWGIELISSKTLLDASPELRKSLSPVFRVIMALVPGFIKKKMTQYRLNQFEIV